MISFHLFIVAASLTGLALFVWWSRVHSVAHRWFAVYTASVASWTVGIAGLQGTHHPNVWVSIVFASASLIPVSLLLFTRSYPSPSSSPRATAVRWVIAVATAFALLSLTSNLIFYDASITSAGFSRKPGVLYPAFAVYFLGIWGIAVGIFISKWRAARGVARVQLQYLGAAIVLSGAGAITTNLLLPLLTGRSTYNWLGPYFQLAFVGIVAHAIIRHRLMDLRMVIHRGLTFAVAMLVSLLPVAVVLVVSWPRLARRLEANELAILLAAIILVSLLIPLTRDVAGRLLDRYVYRTKTDFQRTVRDASRALTRVLDLHKLLAFLSNTLAVSTQSEAIAVYLENDGACRCASVEQRHAGTRFEPQPNAPAVVVKYLIKTKDLAVAEELEREEMTDETRDVHREMTRLGWALVLPLLFEDSVIGLIAVGPKLSGDAFYPDDLDLLMTVANQAGVAIKNAQLYAEVVLANEYIENIVATIESGVIAVNATGQVTIFNRAAAHLTGLDLEAIRGRPFRELPTELATALGNTLGDGQSRTQPEIALSDGTTSRPVICATSSLRDPAGTILGAVAVFSDLTPLKELEIERRRAERLAYFEVLASGIAHEIKNPLVSIKTFAQLVPRRNEDTEFLDKFSRIATREIERMERLVERLRTLSRPGQRPRHVLDVRAPLTHALECVQAALDEKRIAVTVTLGERASYVLGDHAELEELFLNLLVNAHDATPPGGAISIEVQATGTLAAVSVVDSGPGIPEKLLERIFDPFFTTKQQGSGLGLAICAGIAQSHRARLRATNDTGGGALFLVEFPVAAPSATTVPA